jgi:hypothetical protein
MVVLDQETVQAIQNGQIPGIAGIWIPPVPLAKMSAISRGGNGRRRTPSLSTLIRQAEKAGRHVSGAVFEDGKIELKFGVPKADGSNDELSEWMREHHASLT